MVAGQPAKPAQAGRGHGTAGGATRLGERSGAASSIEADAVEAELGTVYAVDTVRALIRRYPKTRFIWLMGADNLAQLHRWHDWRRLARSVAIAVLPRPGYSSVRLNAPAAAWLGHRRHRSSAARDWTSWELPAIVMLDIRLNALTATALRALHPDWARRS